MNNNPSLLRSILTCQCPKCRKSPLFTHKDFRKPSKLFTMHKHCQRCGQTFEPEPGFYFGAMFISYALNTALFIAVWVLYYRFSESLSIFTLLAIMGTAAVIFLPLFFRWSRSIWIAIFVPFTRKSQSVESTS